MFMESGLHDYHQVTFEGVARLSPGCSICGNVRVGSEVTIFAGAHLRGDCAPITVGAGTNIQECCALHVSAGAPLTIGAGVTVGHGAIVHGCTIEDDVLIGMGSVVLDHAHIGRGSLVAAGAVVTEGKEFPPGSLIMGVPAKAVRQLTEEDIQAKIIEPAQEYVEVGAAMVADGVLKEVSAGTNIWPTCLK